MVPPSVLFVGIGSTVVSTPPAEAEATAGGGGKADDEDLDLDDDDFGDEW